MLLPQFAYAKENLVLKGYWFECEFSEKTVPPKDQCEMLDDDGFNFKEDVAIHVKNISSKETKCKKNKIGQCFQSNTNRFEQYISSLFYEYVGPLGRGPMGTIS